MDQGVLDGLRGGRLMATSLYLVGWGTHRASSACRSTKAIALRGGPKKRSLLISMPMCQSRLETNCGLATCALVQLSPAGQVCNYASRDDQNGWFITRTDTHATQGQQGMLSGLALHDGVCETVDTRQKPWFQAQRLCCKRSRSLWNGIHKALIQGIDGLEARPIHAWAVFSFFQFLKRQDAYLKLLVGLHEKSQQKNSEGYAWGSSVERARLQKPSWEALILILVTSFTFAPITRFPKSSTAVPHLETESWQAGKCTSA